MEVDSVVAGISLIGTTFGLLVGGVTAAVALLEKARDSRRTLSERRQKEILRLAAVQKQVEAETDRVFGVIFDYDSDLDYHLRVVPGGFSPAEVQTRIRVDTAFEFLRQVHTSVSLGLIRIRDLGPWVYWIHRARSRPPLMAYATAFGYNSFLEQLADWTRKSSEFRSVASSSPWILDSSFKRHLVAGAPPEKQ